MDPKKPLEKDYFTVSEFDQAGNNVANYFEYPAEKGSNCIDMIISSDDNSILKKIINVFLPAGYPGSVTADYLPYQFYDSLQAFSSSIAGMISSRAVLEGIGVGDSDASPTSALLLSILQESMGRIATILFAHRLGTSLEPECKMYRLSADIFNDSALIFDCLSPAFSKSWRIMFWSLSSILRSLCGVAAGSSKASLSAHFATQGNLGELNAKDSSQETVISLLGMLAGSLIVPHISSKFATWTALIFLLIIHLATNYLAVKSVCMRKFNRQRANIFLSQIIDNLYKSDLGIIEQQEFLVNSFSEIDIPSPRHVSLKERIFERDGVLRWKGGKPLGYCKLGVPLKSILGCFGSPDPQTASFGALHSQKFRELLHIYEKSDYILYFDKPRETFLVTIKSHHENQVGVHMKAWIQALYLANFGISDGESLIEALHRSCMFADCLGNIIMSNSIVKKLGWDLESSAMEVHSGTRIEVGTKNLNN